MIAGKSFKQILDIELTALYNPVLFYALTVVLQFSRIPNLHYITGLLWYLESNTISVPLMVSLLNPILLSAFSVGVQYISRPITSN